MNHWKNFESKPLIYNFLETFPFLHLSDQENSVVVITGASSGIGRQLAIEYSKRQSRYVV